MAHVAGTIGAVQFRYDFEWQNVIAKMKTCMTFAAGTIYAVINTH
jgi:hypothetical protein